MYAFFWNESNESFSSEFKATAGALRDWFDFKIKHDAAKMSNIRLCRFEEGLLVEEVPVLKHRDQQNGKEYSFS